MQIWNEYFPGDKTGCLTTCLESMFTRQEHNHALLTDNLFWHPETASVVKEYSSESCYNSDKRIITIERFNFILFYIQSRYLRHNEKLLLELNIKNKQSERYYEFDPEADSCYIKYINEKEYHELSPEVRKCTKSAPFFNYYALNPEGAMIPVYLKSLDRTTQRFNIIANHAPFSKYHFVVYSENNGFRGLKQIYHDNMLFWIDDLFCQLNNHNYRLFFTPKGSGNSVDTLHFQLIKSSFPVFEYLDKKYKTHSPVLTETDKSDWPFSGIFVRYTPDSREKTLIKLNREIHNWLSQSNDRTFNLLFQLGSNYYREFFFIFRKKGFNYIPGIKNAIAGYEAAGNIVVEDKKEYDTFPSIINRFELIE
jgi:hypothetical protein